MDNAARVATAKRGLLNRATKLLDAADLARRLNVPPMLLQAWMRGDATMPDGKLMDLARVLDKMSREERASTPESGSS